MPTTTLKIVLYKSHKLNNGFHPLKLRITHDRRTTYINLGEYCHRDNWSEHRNWIATSHPSYSNLNILLQSILKKANDNLYALRLNQGDDYILEDVVRVIKMHKPELSLSEYYQVLITRLKAANRIGTAQSYYQAHLFLVRHNQGRDLDWSRIAIRWLNEVETAHLAAGNSLGGLSVHFRCLRSVINQAISEGVYQRTNPFERYKIKNTKTRKRALSLSTLRRLKHLDIPTDHPQRLSRDLFFASFYLQGINFTDLVQLRKTDLEDDRILYTRQKIGKPISVKVTDPLREILDQYHNNPTDYLFPVLDPKSPASVYNQVRNRNKKFNQDLKILSEKAKIPGTITGYTARHTWASLANEQQIPITVISQALGHTSLKTTQIYLDELSTELMDKATEQMSQI